MITATAKRLEGQKLELIAGRISFQVLDPFSRRNYISQSYTEFLVNDHDFPVSYQRPVHHDIHRFTGDSVEFYHRSLIELEKVTDIDPGPAYLD